VRVVTLPPPPRPRRTWTTLADKIVEALGRNNEAAYRKYKHGVRDAHAKSHGVLRGELSVYPELASHLRLH
jgi:hypothetical protein